MTDTDRVVLGETYRDSATNHDGVATARSESLGGLPQVKLHISSAADTPDIGFTIQR